MSNKAFRTKPNKLVREDTLPSKKRSADSEEVKEKIVELIKTYEEVPNKVKVLVYDGGSLFLRVEPAKGSKVLGLLYSRTKLEVSYLNDEWAEVFSVEGLVTTGFVMRAYIREV